MTEKDAYRILGLSEGASWESIKKRYRERMHQVHPDAQIHRKNNKLDAEETEEGITGAEEAYAQGASAQEVNEAYRILQKREPKSVGNAAAKKVSKAKKKTENWKGPVFEQAFCPRKIYQTVEDAEGERIGDFCIAEGKFYWTLEEEFSLFLKSVTECGKELLAAIESEEGKEGYGTEKLTFQIRLTYLLAIQFIDSRASLRFLAKEQGEGDNLQYELDAAAELEPAEFSSDDGGKLFREGDILYPREVKNHRLFLMDAKRRTVGYLSFPDDRLYYVVIPLFEQKSVQIKIRVAEKKYSGEKTMPQAGRRSAGKEVSGRKHYLNLKVWLRFAETSAGKPENQAMQIERILMEYRDFLKYRG